MNNSVKKTTLYSCFPGYSPRKIKECISLLSTREKELLKSTYGKNYDINNFSNLSESGKKEIEQLPKKMQLYLSGVLSRASMVTLKSKTGKNNISLLAYFPDYTYEEIKECTLLLTDYEQELLIRAYGEKYDSVDGYISLEPKEKRKISYIKKLINKLLTDEEKRKDFVRHRKLQQPFLNYFKKEDRDTVIELVSQLTPKRQEILRIVYGENLDTFNGYQEISRSDKNVISIVRGQIYDVLSGKKDTLPSKNKKGRPVKPLREYVKDYDEAEINKCLSMLNENYLNILQKAYGDNYDDSSNFHNLTHNEQRIANKLRIYIRKLLAGEITQIPNLHSRTEGQSLVEYLNNIDENIVREIVSYLSEEEQGVLQKVYGENYNEFLGLTSLNKNEINKLYRVRQKLKETVEGKRDLENLFVSGRGKRAKSLENILSDYSYEQIVEGIKELSSEDQYQLRRAYGDDYQSVIDFYLLDNTSKRRIGRIHTKLRKILIKANHNQPSNIKPIEIIPDTLNISSLSSKSNYQKLSIEEEQNYMRKAKLSYYYDVDKDKQKQYLDYYFEVFPYRKKRYQEILSNIQLVTHKIQELYQYCTHQENGLEYNNEQLLENLKALSKKLKELEKKRIFLLNQYIDHSKEYRNKFLKINQPLVEIIARKRLFAGVSFDDLVAEGNIGMMKALERFRIGNDNKFGTYASFLILKNISRFLMEKQRTIRFPVFLEEKIYKMNKTREEYYNQYHRYPTDEELANILDWETVDIQRINTYVAQTGRPSSLDQLITEDAEESFYAFLSEEDREFRKLEDKMLIKDLAEIIKKANLEKIEAYVLYHRLGFDNDMPKSYNQISKETNLSINKIKGIEASAYDKISSIAEDRGLIDSDYKTPNDIEEKPTFKEISQEQLLKIYTMYNKENKSIEEISIKLGIPLKFIEDIIYDWEELNNIQKRLK